MKKITDPTFRYTPSFNTDLRKKFRKMEQDRRAAAAQQAKSNVQQIKKVK